MCGTCAKEAMRFQSVLHRGTLESQACSQRLSRLLATSYASPLGESPPRFWPKRDDARTVCQSWARAGERDMLPYSSVEVRKLALAAPALKANKLGNDARDKMNLGMGSVTASPLQTGKALSPAKQWEFPRMRGPNTYICMCIYTYMDTERERERERPPNSLLSYGRPHKGPPIHGNSQVAIRYSQDFRRWHGSTCWGFV